MKAITLAAILLLIPAIAAFGKGENLKIAEESADATYPEGARAFINELIPKIAKVKSATVYIISPHAFKADNSRDGKAVPIKTFEDPAGEEHEIFEEKNFSGPSVEKLTHAIILAFETKPFGVTMCFDPAHGIVLKMEDGSEYKLAVCIHCGDMAFDLPHDRFRREGFKDMDDPTLTATLKELMPLSEFLEKKFFGITSREEEEEALRYQRNEDHWIQAMPPSLREVAKKQDDSSTVDDNADTIEALAREYPNKSDRIMALFSWYGSGAGPWSGYMSYEDVPAKLLFHYSTPELLEAISSTKLTESQIEGAGRFFAGWEFRQKRQKDLDLLPNDLRQTLLKHALESTDEDKKSRAKSAFSLKGH